MVQLYLNNNLKRELYELVKAGRQLDDSMLKSLNSSRLPHTKRKTKGHARLFFKTTNLGPAFFLLLFLLVMFFFKGFTQYQLPKLCVATLNTDSNGGKNAH